MTPTLTTPAPPLALSSPAREALRRRIERAVATAHRERRAVLASVTVPLAADIDLAALVLRARTSEDRYFCLEQPDRDRFALAALGQAAAVEAHGPGRFAEASAACRALARGAEVTDAGEDPARPPAAGAVFVGGFSFAPHGGLAPEWGSLAPALLVMPEVSLARRGDEARLTVNAVARPGDRSEALLDRALARVATLRPKPMPLFDPDLVGSARVGGAAAPEHYEAAVARAVEEIASGRVEKVVLAREVRVLRRDHIDPAPVLDALRAAFPACYCYCVGTPELAFVGASPELLIRRDGERAQTVALAGTTRRSADPAVDAHLGEQLFQSPKNREEQAIVTRRIEQTLEPVSLWVSAAEEPVLIRVQNVQHLATPIRAQLAQPVSVLELAGLLHPTPAVGGEPRDRALEMIPALEGLDRGWYAGPIGYMDLAEDGELFVALRCALLRGTVAHLYAGDGIVRDSIPSEELAETEVKLEALLPLLT